MLWNPAKALFKQDCTITTRVTVAITLMTFCILMLMSTLLYFSLQRTLDKAGHQFLLDEAATIRDILRNQPNDIDALKQEVIWNPAPNKWRKDRAFFYYIRILSEDGHLILASPHMTATMQQAPFPRAVSLQDMPRRAQHWQSASGESYLLLSLHTPLGRDGKQQRLIQIALDVSYQDAILHVFWFQVFEVTLLGMLLAAVISYWIAKLSLRKLHSMTRTARAITVNDLHQRFDPSHWPGELSDLARAFNEMLHGIEGAFSRLSRFSADLAHELRTPFSNLMGEAEIALSRARNEKEYRQVIESSLEEYQRLVTLIESMLFLARTQHPETQLNKQAIDVAEEIAAICEFHQPLAEEKNIQLSHEGDGHCQADPALFRQALSNLLSNALQYTPVGGAINIISQCDDQGRIRISVKDTGIGIPEKDLPHIFERFYRVDTARSQHSGGAGLGLSIVASIMRLHRGEVRIDSEPGKFTHSQLIFPDDKIVI